MGIVCFAIIIQGNKNTLAVYITSGLVYSMLALLMNEVHIHKGKWYDTCESLFQLSVISGSHPNTLKLSDWKKSVHLYFHKCLTIASQLFIFCVLQIKHKKNNSFRRSAFNMECFPLDFYGNITIITASRNYCIPVYWNWRDRITI